MSDIFDELQYPFVFVDSSHALRRKGNCIEKLTRRLVKKTPQRFFAIIEELETSSSEDTLYYEQIIQLQRKGVISTLITCEAVNRRIVDSTTDIIHIFGTINSMCLRSKAVNDSSLSDLVLWGENVQDKTYNKIANVLLSASCVVVDETIMSLQIGKLISQHTKRYCQVYYLSDRKKGGNHTEYDLPPKQFIQQLASAQQATD